MYVKSIVCMYVHTYVRIHIYTHILYVRTWAQGFNIMYAEESEGFQLFNATASLYLIGT